MTRPTQAQMEVLVEFLEENREAARGLLRTQLAKQETKRKWAQIAISLNALGGVVKDGPGWSKYWAEKKCSLKRLCAQQAQSMRRTGGGTQAIHSLSEIELRLVAVVGGQSFATGNSDVAVDPFPQRTQSEVQLDAAGTVGQPENTSQPQAESEIQTLLVDTDSVQQPASTLRHSPPRRSQSRRHRSQINIEMDKFAEIESRRVEAEMATARALGDISDALREGMQLVAAALRVRAQHSPPPAPPAPPSPFS